MAPWQSLVARQDSQGQTLNTNLASTVAPVPTQDTSTSLVIDSQFNSSTIPNIEVPFITVTATPTPTPTPTPTSALTSASTPKNGNSLGLPIPVIIALTVGIFVFLAILLVLFMCLRGRKTRAKSQSKPKRDKSWRRMEEREREKSFGNINMFLPLRVSLPEVSIPNPFGASPVSPKDTEDNSRSEDSHNGPIFLGNAAGLHTVKSVETEKRHVSLSTPISLGSGYANPFIFSNDAPRSREKLHPPPGPSLDRDSSQSNYLDMDSARSSANSTPIPRNSSPAPAASSKVGLPSTVRPPPAAIVRDQNKLSSVGVATAHMSSRPSVQALITALDATPAVEAPPLSAASYVTGITAIGTPRSSYVRTSVVPQPPGIPVINAVPADSPTTPRTPRGTPLLLRSISKDDIHRRPPGMDVFDRAPSPSPLAKSGVGAGSRAGTPTLMPTPTPALARLSAMSTRFQPAPSSEDSHVTSHPNEREPVRDSLQTAEVPLRTILRPGWSRDSENPSVYSMYSRSSVYSDSSSGTVMARK